MHLDLPGAGPFGDFGPAQTTLLLERKSLCVGIVPPCSPQKEAKHVYTMTLKAGICREVPSSAPWAGVHKEQKSPAGVTSPFPSKAPAATPKVLALGQEGVGGDLADWMTNKEGKGEADVPGATVTSKLPA